jgi:5-methylcytosine-specific restriction endonuclease McrA
MLNGGPMLGRKAVYSGRQKPANFSARGGAMPRDKEKQRAYDAAWRIANRDRIRASKAAYYTTNREKICAYQASYYAENAEKVRTRNAAYRSANPKKVRANSLAYYASHTTEAASNAAKRRAMKRSVTIGNQETIRSIYRQARENKRVICYICGELIPLGARHVDHVMPLARGGKHTASNLAIACARCNLSKNAKMPEDVGLLL